MYDSRQAFSESKSNKKLHRGIRSKLRLAIGLTYPLGDHVLYNRNDSNL